MLTEAIGIAAALKPALWLDLYGTDPVMLDFGSRYLRIVGPFFGFFGFGLALYFASQGTGRLLWPLAAGLTRLVTVACGAFIAIVLSTGTTGIYVALARGHDALLGNQYIRGLLRRLAQPHTDTPRRACDPRSGGIGRLDPLEWRTFL